jgi:hypothetical protein
MNKFFYALIVPLFLALQMGPVHAADETDANKAKGTELTKEERQAKIEMHEKMANMHKGMVDCLRADKPMAECREQMMKDCPMAKSGHCPMMDEMGGMMQGMGGMMGGEHHGGKGMMKGNKTDKPKQK